MKTPQRGRAATSSTSSGFPRVISLLENAIEGWLEIKGSKVKGWRRVYARLEGCELSLDRGKKGDHDTTLVDLTGCRVQAHKGERDVLGGGQREHCFSVVHHERGVRVLQAGSADDVSDWVRALQGAVYDAGAEGGEDGARDEGLLQLMLQNERTRFEVGMIARPPRLPPPHLLLTPPALPCLLDAPRLQALSVAHIIHRLPRSPISDALRLAQLYNAKAELATAREAARFAPSSFANSASPSSSAQPTFADFAPGGRAQNPHSMTFLPALDDTGSSPLRVSSSWMGAGSGQPLAFGGSPVPCPTSPLDFLPFPLPA